MSYTINRVVLVGRLTRDPELRALPSGSSVCSLRIACNSSRRDSEGNFAEKPNFFDVSVYGAAADTDASKQTPHAPARPSVAAVV
jgi:single-strand DNA-binding protein